MGLPRLAAKFISEADWSDKPVVIVASGKSAQYENISDARQTHRVIVVNNSWQLAPWADAIYAHDFSWWKNNAGLPDFSGIKFCGNTHYGYRDGWNLMRIQTEPRSSKILYEPPGRFGFGSNSGFWALNLAVQLKASRIILVGFDMHGKHWHPDHAYRNPKETSFPQWIKSFENSAPELLARGIDVINTSQKSALTCFRRETFQESISCRYHHRNLKTG